MFKPIKKIISSFQVKDNMYSLSELLYFKDYLIKEINNKKNEGASSKNKHDAISFYNIIEELSEDLAKVKGALSKYNYEFKIDVLIYMREKFLIRKDFLVRLNRKKHTKHTEINGVTLKDTITIIEKTIKSVEQRQAKLNETKVKVDLKSNIIYSLKNNRLTYGYRKR